MKTQEFDAKEASDVKTITSYLVRCTTEQKEFLQKIIVDSGQSAAQFLVEAASHAALKNTQTEFLQDELAEVDSLIGRLSRLMKAKMYLACEKEKQVEEDLKANALKKAELETQWQNMQSEAELKINEERKNLELEYLSKEEALKAKFEEEKNEQEKINEKIIKENDILHKKLAQKIQEITIHEKQYADSIKLHQNIEDRNLELKNQNDEFKKELLEFKKFKNEVQFIEKERDELKSKIELLNAMHAQEIKNLHAEFDLKTQILSHEIEKKFSIRTLGG